MLDLTRTESIAVILSGIFTFLSFIFTIYNFVQNKKNKAQDLFTQIDQRTSEARHKYQESLVSLGLKDAERYKYNSHAIPEFYEIEISVLTNAYNSSLEEYFNTIDIACYYYLEKHLDRKIFKSNFKSQIIDFVEDDTFTEHFGPQTSYKYFLKVYQHLKEES